MHNILDTISGLVKSKANIINKTIEIKGWTNNKDINILNQDLKNQELELLISVSGVGTKTALTMLAICEPSEFALAVISEDIKTLTTIPGIGPKSAKRIILELKDKIKKEQQIEELTNASKGIKQNTETNIKVKQAIQDDNKILEAIAALQVLGYNRKSIEKAFEKIEDKKELSTEDLIKKGLLLLGKEL